MPDDPVGFVAESLRRAWRWLTRMRTALLLLGGLALETLLATVVPQEPNVPRTVARWRAGEAGPGPTVSSLIDAVGGYDVYGSALFLALLLLLFISLTACLARRYPALWRVLRHSRPPRSRHLEDKPHVRRLVSQRSPGEVEAEARAVLSGRRWRLREEEGGGDGARQVAAEKGQLLREGGSLVFHTSFYLLLVGVVAGQLWGFTAQIGVVEGEPGFTDTPISYTSWSYDPGRLWSEDDHPGFQLRLDAFDVGWRRDPALGGQPTHFVSEVTIRERDGTSRQTTVSPNDPLIVDGLRIHQLDWGYAPRVVVRADGRVVHDGFLQLRRSGEGFWTGAVKAPAADPGIGLEVFLWSYAPAGEDGRPQLTGAPWADAPLMVFREYRGDLRLEASQDVNRLDTSTMQPVDDGGLRPGGQVTLSDGVTVSFPELRRWSGLQVSNKPTLGLLLVAGLLTLGGLIPSLYAYRRRLWVEARPRRDRTLVVVAGRAFQRPEAFVSEFETLVESLGEAVGTGAERPAEEPVPASAARGVEAAGRARSTDEELG